MKLYKWKYLKISEIKRRTSYWGSSEFSSYEIELLNRVTQNNVTLRATNFITGVTTFITFLCVEVLNPYLNANYVSSVCFTYYCEGEPRIIEAIPKVIAHNGQPLNGYLEISALASRHQHRHWCRPQHRHFISFILPLKVSYEVKHPWWSTLAGLPGSFSCCLE